MSEGFNKIRADFLRTWQVVPPEERPRLMAELTLAGATRGPGEFWWSLDGELIYYEGEHKLHNGRWRAWKDGSERY